MVWYGMLQYDTVWYGMVQYGTVWYGMMAFLSLQDLGRLGRTCTRLRAISYSDCLWLNAAR